jgi:hypothetical protein
VLDKPKPRSRRSSVAQIGFAQVSIFGRAPLDLSSGEALSASLVPGVSRQRYRRIWRMGQWRQDKGVIFGRIGFEGLVGPSERWNAELQDFEPTELYGGYTSPFAIDLATLRVAFQLRSQTIEMTTFTANFAALLNEATDIWRWRVTPDVRTTDWEAWVHSLSRVTRVDATLLLPNPHFEFDDIEELMEKTNSAALEIIAKADPDDAEGINVGEGFLAHVIEHVKQYGTLKATGETAQGRQTEWRKGGTPERTRAPANPESSEVEFETLREQLEGDEEEEQ